MGYSETKRQGSFWIVSVWSYITQTHEPLFITTHEDIARAMSRKINADMILGIFN